MNCSDAQAKLAAQADEPHRPLVPAVARELDAHLAQCADCRAARAALIALSSATTALPRERMPENDLWPAIAAQIPASPAPASRRVARARLGSFRWGWVAIATSVVLTAGIGTWTWQRHAAAPAWAVAALSGAPRVNATPVGADTRLRVGQWLETDATSSARLEVGAIGEVQIAPGSRVRLVGASATDHRLELARGTLHALIWSPPRLFFVETPAATAVDLGCAYTLEVDAAGHGLLQVTAGYVALEHAGRESLIPAGMRCATRRGAGPGTPFAEDASPALRAALARVDFELGDAGGEPLDVVLREARSTDAITLWHLLARVPAERREDVFTRLATLQAPPAGVTRDGILRGDATMRVRWAVALGLAAADLGR